MAMRALFGGGGGLGLVLGLLAGVPAGAEPVEHPASAQQAALGLVDALRQGDEAGALAHCLDFPGWASLSNRRLDRVRHERELRQWLGGLARELGAAGRGPEPVLADVLRLPRDEKLRRPVTMAIFHLALAPAGRPASRPHLLTLAFVEHAGRWWFILRD
jgi:hypothetical protein